MKPVLRFAMGVKGLKSWLRPHKDRKEAIQVQEGDLLVIDVSCAWYLWKLHSPAAENGTILVPPRSLGILPA